RLLNPHWYAIWAMVRSVSDIITQACPIRMEFTYSTKVIRNLSLKKLQREVMLILATSDISCRVIFFSKFCIIYSMITLHRSEAPEGRLQKNAGLASNLYSLVLTSRSNMANKFLRRSMPL